MPSDAAVEVLEKLRNFESMTLAEVTRMGTYGKGIGGQQVEAGGVCGEAQRRLQDLGLDDADTLFEFRLGGRTRIWAIQYGVVFHFLWWDPEHTVWPSEKRNT